MIRSGSATSRGSRPTTATDNLYKDLSLEALQEKIRQARKLMNATPQLDGFLRKASLQQPIITDTISNSHIESKAFDFDDLPSPTGPRIDSNSRPVDKFNSLHLKTRQQCTASILEWRKMAEILKKEQALLDRQQERDKYEAAVRHHKENLRRQLSRGQELEVVQRSTISYDITAQKNVQNDCELYDSILSSMLER